MLLVDQTMKKSVNAALLHREATFSFVLEWLAHPALHSGSVHKPEKGEGLLGQWVQSEHQRFL